MKKIRSTLGIVIFLLALFAPIFFLVNWVHQLLWNWSLAEVFDLPQLTYWQSARILLYLVFLSGFIYGWNRSK